MYVDSNFFTSFLALVMICSMTFKCLHPSRMLGPFHLVHQIYVHTVVCSILLLLFNARGLYSLPFLVLLICILSFLLVNFQEHCHDHFRSGLASHRTEKINKVSSHTFTPTYLSSRLRKGIFLELVCAWGKLPRFSLSKSLS